MEDHKQDQHSALLAFIARKDSLDHLAHLTANTSPEDQDYIAEQINKMLHTMDLRAIDGVVSEHMAIGETQQEITQFVLDNQAPVRFDPTQTTPAFQEMVMRLRTLSDQGQDAMAKAIMLYGASMAHYEWKDRQRGATPYNAEEHGPITLAQPTPEGLG